MVQAFLSTDPTGGVLREALHDKLDSLNRQLLFYAAKLGDVADN